VSVAHRIRPQVSCCAIYVREWRKQERKWVDVIVIVGSDSSTVPRLNSVVPILNSSLQQPRFQLLG